MCALPLDAAEGKDIASGRTDRGDFPVEDFELKVLVLGRGQEVGAFLGGLESGVGVQMVDLGAGVVGHC